MTVRRAGRLAAWALSAALLAAGLAGCRSVRGRGERLAFRKVGPPVAYEIVRDTPEILILDLRTPAEFQGETGHLRGARNLPLDRLSYRLLEISEYRDETFLVYCREKDTCGEDGAAILAASGFPDAILIEGGIDNWIRQGFKTVLTVDEPGGGPRP